MRRMVGKVERWFHHPRSMSSRARPSSSWSPRVVNHWLVLQWLRVRIGDKGLLLPFSILVLSLAFVLVTILGSVLVKILACTLVLLISAKSTLLKAIIALSFLAFPSFCPPSQVLF